MRVYLTPLDGRIVVNVRPTGDGLVGDAAHEMRVVLPGEAYRGIPYETLLALGEGEHELSEMRPQTLR